MMPPPPPPTRNAERVVSEGAYCGPMENVMFAEVWARARLAASHINAEDGIGPDEERKEAR